MIHPAENRGYRELYLTSRQLVSRWRRLAGRLPAGRAADEVAAGSEAVAMMVVELGPLTARRDLYGGPAVQTGGGNIGLARAAVADRFLERNQALRLAVDDLEHVTTLLAYLAAVGETRGDEELVEFCGSWERRLRRRVSAIRRAAVELGADPDSAIEPLDHSPAGRAAHGLSYAFGSVGEWVDRRLSRRR